MRIIAYTYDAAIHCPDCTAHAWLKHRLTSRLLSRCGQDEHALPNEMEDREGNPVHPVFITDEISDTYCGTCHVAFS